MLNHCAAIGRRHSTFPRLKNKLAGGHAGLGQPIVGHQIETHCRLISCEEICGCIAGSHKATASSKILGALGLYEEACRLARTGLKIDAKVRCVATVPICGKITEPDGERLPGHVCHPRNAATKDDEFSLEIGLERDRVHAVAQRQKPSHRAGRGRGSSVSSCC